MPSSTAALVYLAAYFVTFNLSLHWLGHLRISNIMHVFNPFRMIFFMWRVQFGSISLTPRDKRTILGVTAVYGIILFFGISLQVL